MTVWQAKGGSSLSDPLTEAQVKGLLQRFDRDGDGRISRTELRAAFKQMGFWFCNRKAGCAIRKVDDNGDGVISGDELNELVKYAHSRWGFTIS
nr:Calcium-binding protein CML10 [Ipomoea batatas]GMD91435.1 Calcium-binding protein CML10 [Ipomoea batatas]GMD93665.1 Calcium-binding protein CML10 [Ipomoea batatas]GME09289.1 Calcium-binding protein CML10 [Ipomoea batatas]